MYYHINMCHVMCILETSDGNSIQFSLFTLIHNVNLQEWKRKKKKGKKKHKGKVAYMCTRYYFEIVRSDQRSRAFELATTTVQLIVRGSY